MDEKILSKFKEKFSFRVTRVLQNPNMKDWTDATHFRVLIKNKTSGKSATFYFSQGRGHTDYSDEHVLFGLLSSLLMDSSFETLEDFKGIYDDEKQAEKVFLAVKKNSMKVKIIGLERFFKSLSQEELGH